MRKKGDSRTETRLVFLGTGTPNADPERWGPAIAVTVNGIPYVVDAGPGVVRRAVEAGLDVKQLTRAFLTHLHSDHTVGLPDLILTPWVLCRTKPLEVWGPPGTRHMTEHILAAYREDIRERSESLQPSNDTGWKTITHEIAEPGIIHTDDNVKVEAFPVDHGSWKAYGYKFVTPDRSIVISADTAPTKVMVEKAKGCDILVHEVYSLKGFATRSPEWQRYHAAVHTSANQLAEIARKAKPKLLVLYHQLFWGASDEDLQAEIRKGYDGRVVSGRDLEVY